MKLLLATIVMLWCSIAQALPPQAEADMLMIEGGKAAKAQDYATARQKFERVAELNVKVPQSFPFHFGKALSETGAYDRAREQLEKYVTSTGQNGKFYQDALEALSRNSSLEAEEKRKRQDDQVAMAKYNEAMSKYRADQEYYQSVKPSLERCEQREDKCTDRLGEKIHPAYPERVTAAFCERERRKCEEKFHKSWPKPVQPNLPKLNFAESATQFAAQSQTPPPHPVSPASPTAPVPSGRTTIQTAPSPEVRPATISSALFQDSRLAENEAGYISSFPSVRTRTAEQAISGLDFRADVSKVASYHLCPGCQLNVVFYCRSGVAIRNHADFRSLKIRVTPISPLYLELGRLGASSQGMDLAYISDAFNQDLLDCVAFEELRDGAIVSKPPKKQTINVDFGLPTDSRELTQAARTELDSLVGKLAALKLEVILVDARVDSSAATTTARIRADEVAGTVKNYLVGKGVSANLIYAEGKAGNSGAGKASVHVSLQVIGTR